MKEYKLKELLEIKNGSDHKTLPDGDIPVYGSGGLMRYVNKAIYNDESILLPRKGTLDNIQFSKTPFWTVDTLYYTIVNKEKANLYYLYKYLTCLDLSNLNSGTGVPSMTFSSYYGLKVKLPSLEIQSQIASILSSLDDKIELNNKINAELEEMAKTLYDYWFVQFEFPDKNGKPYKSSGGKMVWNEELKREVPEGWEVKRLEEIANVVTGKLDSNAEVVDGKYLFYTCAANPTRTNTFSFDDDVLLIAGNNANGNFHLNRYSGKFDAYQRTYVITSENLFNLNFLYQILKTRLQIFKRKGQGSQTKFLTMGMITDIEFVMPNEEIKGEIAEAFNSFYLKQQSNIKQNQELSALRDWLLPMLMNGQVGVEN